MGEAVSKRLYSVKEAGRYLGRSPWAIRHPPTQEAMAVKPWRNAQRVSAEACGEGGHASAGVAEDKKGTTAVKPWGSTLIWEGHLPQVRQGRRVMVDVVDMDQFIEKHKREANDGNDLPPEEAGPNDEESR